MVLWLSEGKAAKISMAHDFDTSNSKNSFTMAAKQFLSSRKVGHVSLKQRVFKAY